MSHVKTRLPVAVDLAAHMKRVERQQEWKRLSERTAMMFGGYGRKPLSQHEQNMQDYLTDKISIQEYEHREGVRLAS